jgi:hypothetical protein
MEFLLSLDYVNLNLEIPNPSEAGQNILSHDQTGVSVEKQSFQGFTTHFKAIAARFSQNAKILRLCSLKCPAIRRRSSEQQRDQSFHSIPQKTDSGDYSSYPLNAHRLIISYFLLQDQNVTWFLSDLLQIFGIASEDALARPGN